MEMFIVVFLFLILLFIAIKKLSARPSVREMKTRIIEHEEAIREHQNAIREYKILIQKKYERIEENNNR